jgi:ribosomal protein L11 methyltransferase
MISPDTLLYIYEIRGDMGTDLPTPPASFIGLWNEEEFLYLFFTRPKDIYVQQISSGCESVPVSLNVISYRDWQDGLPHAGLTVGGLHFVPDDHPAPPQGSVLLDPSVVFGDGAHPTTLSCLREMQRIVRGCTIASLLDLGTGSGILALAAAATGIRHVVAVDRNRLAVCTTQRNVSLNTLSRAVKLRKAKRESSLKGRSIWLRPIFHSGY